MKPLRSWFTAIIFSFSITACFSQTGEWVWIKGSSGTGQPGYFGTQGVPGPLNHPPGLYEPSEWTDLNGNFWLWGGNGGGNDLWKYNSVTNEWTWMKSGIADYGIQGVSSPTNNPPPRWFGAASWIDTTGDLWMFGGYDTAAISAGNYSDLWKYNISTNQWTWMNGPNIAGQPGNYGTQGVPDPLNYPAGRCETAAAWTDNAGDLWLFGGSSASSLNDLWRYNIATNQWTWMKGSPSFFQPGIYGVQGIEDINNTPPSLMAYSRWKDNSGSLWLFGGYDGVINYNTLWRFNIQTNSWAWINGDTIGNALGSYGTKCISASPNGPPARCENRASWKDPDGNLWFYGGFHYPSYGQRSDLWMYCMATGHWVWVSGDSGINVYGNWGTMGVSSPSNKPGSRFGSVGWTDNNWHLYMFGGWGGLSGPGHYNDLWKYTIDTTCGVCPTSTGIVENNSPNQLLIFPNPVINELTISNFQFQTNDEIIITDVLGKIIFTKKITTPTSNLKLQTSNFSNGIYFIHLNSKQNNFRSKFIKQ